MENSGPVLLIALMWGLYSIQLGTIQPCSGTEIDGGSSDGRDSGLSIRLVWAYSRATSRATAFAAGLVYVLLSYLVIRYERELKMRWCSLVTAAVVVILLGMAVEAVVQDVAEGKNLQQRQELVWAWIVVQSVLLSIGWFRKKLLPSAGPLRCLCRLPTLVQGSAHALCT